MGRAGPRHRSSRRYRHSERPSDPIRLERRSSNWPSRTPFSEGRVRFSRDPSRPRIRWRRSRVRPFQGWNELADRADACARDGRVVDAPLSTASNGASGRRAAPVMRSKTRSRSSACADGSRQLIITLDHACPWRNGWRAEGSSGWEAELVCWTGPQIRMAAAGWTRCRFDPAGADTVVIAEPGGERRRRGWKPLTTVGPVAPIRAERNAGGRIDGYWARPGSWRPVRMLGPVNRSFPTT